MPNRRPLRSHWKFQNSRKRKARSLDRRTSRRSLLEQLEPRQLLAVGPQLAGIQPDAGALLRNGDVREISPRELKFQFNDDAVIDESTLSGIRLTRSDDGSFATAIATSDFNTNGRVVLDFRAQSPGTSGNDIRIDVIKNAAPTASLVSVVGGAIRIELNTTTGTTASQLVAAVNSHPQASQLVAASIRRGTGTTNISEPAITYSPIITSGANAAMAVTDLGVGTSLQMKLTAVQTGPAGLNIALLISRRDFGGVAAPRVTVSGREVSVEVNSNAASPTTAGELVNAINANTAARALLTASLPIGSRDTVIGTRAPNVRIPLVGISDVPVIPGYLGLGDSPREVVMRFSEPLPDAFYYVEVVGSGSAALRDVNGAAFGDLTDDDIDDGSNFSLGFQLDLGAQVLAVVPQPLTRNSVTNLLTQSRSQINVYFNSDDLFPTRVVTLPNPNNDPSVNPSVVDPAFYQLIFTDETVENTDDVIYHPTRIEYDPAADMAVLIFANHIEDLGSGSGTFRLRIGTDESLPVPPLRTVSQSDEGSSFATARAVGLELAVLGNGQTLQDAQTITLTGSVDAAAQVPTTVTFEFKDTALGNPVSGNNVAIPFNASMDQAALTAAVTAAINQSAVGQATSDGNRIALVGTLAAATSAGMTAINVEQLSSMVISSAIEAKPYAITLPGGIDDLGHREIPEEAHVLFGADQANGITTLSYNFRSDIGTDPVGRPLFNLITEAQKERAREIFHIYGELFGVQFIESSRGGLTVATGDMRAIAPDVPSRQGDGLSSLSISFQDPATGSVSGLLILDNAERWDDSFGATDNPGRLSWFEGAMQGVGTLLGLGAATELPAVTLMAGGNLGEPALQFGNPLERVYPGAADIVHGQYLYRPEGQDIDMFRVDIPETGLFSAEVMAERQFASSLLDSVITLYRDVPGGVPELIARNDDYYSNDSYFELELAAGTYWVGVSASGNDQYDPAIEDSGFGGVTEGAYDLRLNFRPDANRALRDATGVALDGDGNGTPGGVYNFWFDAQDEARTIYVDKTPPLTPPTPNPSDPSTLPGGLRNPHSLISTALSDVRGRSRDGQEYIVRIVGNGGPDRDVTTLTDNVPYEIGFNQNGGQLADGAALEVPKGVTVMIDSGAVIKSRRGRIAVGSSSSTIDRSAAALQVLGTPVVLNSAGSVLRDIDGNILPGSVYFTSINDDAIGAARGGIGHPAPGPGDWGGLSFQADIDRADANRVDLEDRGIFLNYVSNADLRYGGGDVIIDGIPQAVSPIQLIDARVTATFNNISFSRDAAISASPDTFEETNFHAPEYQFSPFTSDYQRVGPHLYGNRLVNNSINGLFVRVETPAGNELRSMTVGGRFDDRDITHVIAENLVIQGTPGGAVLEGDGPNVDQVVLESTTFIAIVGDGSTVIDGDTFTITPAATGTPIIFEFVDLTTGRTTTGTQGILYSPAMDQSELAAVIANSISAAGVTAVLNGTEIELNGISRLNFANVAQTISQNGATLPAGIYNYKVVFVDASGNEGIASNETRNVTVTSPRNAVRLMNVPTPTSGIVARRIYRSDAFGGSFGIYTLVGELAGSSTSFVDDGSTLVSTLRPDASLGAERPVTDLVTLESTSVIAVTGDGLTVMDGETFTITPAATGVPVTFEFVDAATGRTTTGTQPVVFATSMDSFELAAVMANSMTAAGIQAVLEADQIALRGILAFTTTSAAISLSGAALTPGVYNYKVVFVDANGNEGAASPETRDVMVASPQNAVRLLNLPIPTAGFVSRRIYRSDATGNPNGVYTLVSELNGSDTFFVDRGTTFGGALQASANNLRARLDARLAIDPGIVVKMDGATIEARFGGQLIAEGLVGQEVVFTSINDDTYGSGGTFDTSNNGFQDAVPGEWGGLYLGHMSRASLDHTQVSFGGGVTRIDGNFTGFNAIEIQQANVRIAHSAFRDNADGSGGQASANRAGHGENDASLIFVRGAQPVIINNMMLNNAGPAISIDADSLDYRSKTDIGRSTYNRGVGAGMRIDMLPGFMDNEGPLVRQNSLGDNEINGMQVRGATLTTQGVWDDTDIVHVLLDQTIYIPDFHTYGGLRLESSATQSLVVKLQGDNAGFTATGRPLDIDDRIGGSLQIVGQPSHPVMITSLGDDSVGAGFAPDGSLQTRTGRIQRPNPGPLQAFEPVPGSGVTLQGNLGVSTDGLGTDTIGTLLAEIPDGATIELALLHVATIQAFRPNFISFAGQPVLLNYLPNVVSPLGIPFETGRADVTNLVATAVGAGGGIFSFNVDETITGAPGSVNGTSLTVIYSHPDLPRSSVIVQDGGLSGATPHRTRVRFSEPIDSAATGFIAQLALGIQDGNDNGVEFSTVDVNGTRLTSSAGGANDSSVLVPAAGNLITVGGVGDSFVNPIDPTLTLDATDDELYNLVPLLPPGATEFFVDITNPAGDDSVFLAVLYLSGDAALSSAQPGDWRSIEIDQFANDRNVDIVTEREPAELAAPGNNFSPNNAQFLGALAPHEKAGDESLRLGFQVHGVIAEPSDYDVYSFDALAGTEVWFDVDRTSYALDTVIELIDANGSVHSGVVLADPGRTVLARSDNSIAEALLPAEEASLNVRPLQKSASNEPDRYTTNPKDAGMRVVLPGPRNSTNTYYLRVRSSSPDLENLGGGTTKGVYQLQIRLREKDEVVGTTVKYSDIRFATNGIEISGQPIHSPLLGEATETLDAAGLDVNDNFATPEVLGNVLNTDRAALGVAGELDLPADVDWFEFDVEYDSIQGQGALIPRHASLIFDVDYADGFARPNTNIWVFNEAGVLVATGRDSNVADDRPAALNGADVDDLTRGSAGALDPFIGPIALPANGTETGRYFVAVTSNAVIPAGLDQFLTPLPSDPLLRLEPSNSVPRIAEDHVNGTNLSNIAQPPQVPVLFDNASVAPFRLSDVGLFVLDNTFGTSRVRMVDPFTGALENTVGVLQANVDDVALDPVQGLLYGYSVPVFQNPSDANTGNYHQIDPRSTNTTSLSVNLGDDGIETYNQDPMNAMPAAIRSNNNVGVGVRFDAIAIGDDGTTPLSGYAVGSRFPGLGVDETRNLLYEFDPVTGAAFSAPRPDRSGNTGANTLTQGAWTNIVERAALDTSFDPFVAPGVPVQGTRAVEATTFDPLTGATLPLIQDGSSNVAGARTTTFTVVGGGTTRTFEFDAGPEVQVLQDPVAATPVTILDGDVFTLDDIAYEFDTGTVFVVTASALQLVEGDTFTVSSIPANPQEFSQLTFEFSTDNNIAATSDLAVMVFQPGTVQDVVAAVVSAINNAPQFSASAVAVPIPGGGARISIINEDPMNPSRENAGGSFFTVQGAPGVFAGRIAIPAEESMTAFELGDAVEAAIDGTNPRGHVASSDLDRLNFRGASQANFGTLAMQPRQVFMDTGSRDGATTLDPSTADPLRTAFPVDFLAADTATDIATNMVIAINSVFGGGTASLAGSVVQLADGFSFTLSPTTAPLDVGGIAPGDDITGMAWVGGQLYAVGDLGGLYQIISPQSFFAEADFVETSAALSGISFTALAAGPTNLENGRFANMLFGIDSSGELYAFDTAGVPQPIFADGQTSVSTGLFGADGLAFSNLDYNLWHVTDARSGDAGHGVEEVVDGSREAEDPADNLSWYFGYESPQANNIANQRLTNPANSFDYNFIGGAHGSLISNPFSLEGFSAEDLPTLYYNYYLETENASATLRATEFMRDSFRAYVSGDDGIWHLVSTNNSARGNGFLDDEFDDPNVFDNINAEVQENFDVGDRNAPDSWRQARIPLGTFAGQSNLRLRFDFDTAGGRGPTTDGLLRQDTVGDEIRALEAALLRDGQTFTLQTISNLGTVQTDVFELDFGYTLVAPGGAALVEGDSFTVNGTTYIFDDTATIADPTANLPGSVAVPFATSDSALSVADSIALTIQLNPPAPVVTVGDLNERTQPSNDTLNTAADSTLRGITATFQAAGEIGDSQNIPNALDVDLVRLELQVGDTVNVDFDANPNSPLFDGYLRIFDANGVELSASSSGAAPGEPSVGVDPFLSFTATVTGTYYIGVSDELNPFYDPRALPTNPPIPNTVRREYNLDVSVAGAAGLLHQQGNRINLPNAQTVTSSGTPAGFVEGNASVSNGFPVNLHSNMSAAEVANEISLALASYCPVVPIGGTARFCAEGAPGVFPTRDEVITIIGHTVSGQTVGPWIGQPLGVADPLFGDRFGAFAASTNFDGTTDANSPGALRLQDNDHEGLYLDDFIIGVAERGEMVSGASAATNFVPNAAQPDDEIDEGPYQLEIRRSEDFGISLIPPTPTFLLLQSFDSNARLGEQTTITASPGSLLWDGQTFEVTDGLGILTFEFDDDALDGAPNNAQGNGVAPGHVALPFRVSSSANEIAELIRDTMNKPAVQTRVKITAALADGAELGTLGSSSTLNLFGNAIVTLDPLSSLSVAQGTGVGDSNRERDQGQLIIQSNTIRNSLSFGIVAGPGERDISALAPLAGNLPHAGPVRVTREVNSARLVPGVVIANNVVANNEAGGIQFSGDQNPAGQQLASMAFGRIVNNTIVGLNTGTGIEVGANASPTLLNNIVADFTTGISVDASSLSTVVGGTLYRGNLANTLGIGIGSFPLVLANSSDPLFVDQQNDNYYLAPDSFAIDSSVDSLPDRPALTLVRGPLGINPSPILAPKEDVLGQTRVDDPSVPSRIGQGANVFKDRGAIDRADFAGPTPVLISPQDNDALGRDADHQVSFVSLTNQTLQNFSIQLLDGVEPSDPENGTGASDASVRSNRLTLFRDDVQLVEGIDYKFTYDKTNNIIRLTPLAGIWESDHRYDIKLSNSRGFLITAPDGAQIVDGDSFTLADEFGNSVNFEFDSGYVLQVPQTLALQIPAAGGALITDRDTITVTDSVTANTVVFEFDLDGFVTAGNIRIPFTRTNSANEVAQAIVAALQAGDVGLSPVNHVNFGGRAVHLGTRPTHTVDLSNSPFVATGQVGGIDDGQTFLVDDGTQRIIFEFTSTGSLTTGDQAIPFSFAQTNEQIAQTIATAVGSAGLGLSPEYIALSDGLINVGGDLRHFIDASTSALILSGTPGVTPEFGLRIPTVAGQLDFGQIMDGEQFTITNGTDSLTVELDDNGVVSPGVNPLVVVNFTQGTTVDQLANAVAIAIRNGDIGLSPANAGQGVINLLNSAQQMIDLTNSSFTQRGTAGVPSSLAVPFDAGTSFTAGTTTRVPIDSAETVAAAITQAINNAAATSRLQGVVATQQGTEVNLEGVDESATSGLGTLSTSDIVDVAGNPLKSNRTDGTTQFTITIASGLDYGDAPAPYPTLLANDGARHQASADFALGSRVDVDFDGQPTATANGDDISGGLDDEDGVTFPNPLVGGGVANISVFVTGAGLLDAWIDFNRDGDWSDAGEQIFTSRQVNSGLTSLPVSVPGNALPGATFARFRLSSSGGLPPTGLAADGEVEDYRVSIIGNPWHNSANPLDVDSSGFVVPLDALIVINYINANGTGPLLGVPGPGDHQVDTNADGSVTAIDVLLVVNALNALGAPEGESGVGHVAVTSPETLGDPLALLTTDVVIDQRIDIYDQREPQAQMREVIREAARVHAKDAVFSTAVAMASVSGETFDSDFAHDIDVDELEDLTFERPWSSGVDDIFGDWV